MSAPDPRGNLSEKQLKELVQHWRSAEPLLQAVRDEDIRSADTAQAIDAFNGLFEEAVRRFPPPAWSGLVEFYAVLMNKRKV